MEVLLLLELLVVPYAVKLIVADLVELLLGTKVKSLMPV